MVGSPLAILSQAVSLTHAPSVAPALRIKRILRLLRRTLGLEDALLQFRSGQGRRFDAQIAASGPALVSPSLLPPSPLKSNGFPRAPEYSPDALCVPIRRGFRHAALLYLCRAPGSLLESSDFLSGIAALLSGLVDQLEPRTAKGEDETSQLHEMTLLNGLSRFMHSTLRLDEQMHFLLSGLASPELGGFERAMLFMVNKRSGMLQGMLGVTHETVAKIFPDGAKTLSEGAYCLNEDILDEQRRHVFSLAVRQQRLSLNPEKNALAKAALQKRVVFVEDRLTGSAQVDDLALELGLYPYVCVPLGAHGQSLAVVVADNPLSGRSPQAQQRRFLELFASQAGQALENALLVQRLETAHEDLRKTQDQLIQGEKLAAVGEMAASVAHELKNPLVVIGGFAKRLARKVSDATDEHQYALTIAREVGRLEKMLDSILAFSKKSLLCLTSCELERIVDDAIVFSRGSDDGGRIRYEVDLQPELPNIQGDEQKLRQVLVNLLLNARQAVEGGGRISVRGFRGALRRDEAVVLEVSDSGSGIPSDVIRNIFNPFFTTRTEGTGLGLSIVQRIIEQHHGHIEVHNSDQGALFRVYLPRKQPCRVERF